VSRVFCSLRGFFSTFPFSQAASVATLPSALLVSDFSLGASWVFSIQQVLLPGKRPRLSYLRGKLDQELSQSPELGGRARLFGTNSLSIRLSMPLRSLPSGYCAVVRTLLHSPTTDAAVPPAFVPPLPPLVSCRFSLRAPRASAPSAANHYLPQRVPECSALLAPTASVNTRLPLC
jgi:hypothetical protein